MATIQWRKHRRKDGSTTRTATLNWVEGGIRCRKSLGAISPEDAKTALSVKDTELRTGKIIFSVAPLFADFAQVYLDWRATEYPDSQYRVDQLVCQHLVPAFRYTQIDQIRPLQVEQYKQDRLKLVSEETVSKEIRQLKALLNKAAEWELIDYSPIRFVRPPQVRTSKPIHWYSMEELLQLYRQAGERKAIWQLFANTGMRRGEGLNLRRTDDKGESIILQSQPGARTKSRKWREVPLSPNGREALDTLLEASDTEFVLPRMQPANLSHAFEDDRGSLPGSLHSLRHTFGTLLAVKGVKIMELKTLMGHASIKTTEKYLHVAQDHLREAISGFNV